MVSTDRARESPRSPRTAAIDQVRQHRRLKGKTRRLEGVVAALQAHRRERVKSGLVPPPLDHALEDFTEQLAALRSQSDAVSAGRAQVPPSGVA